MSQLTRFSDSAQNGAHPHGHAQNGHNGTASLGLTTPAELAARWQLKAQSNGKWSGPHPTNKAQASKDGFTLCPEGNAFTNSGEKYSSRQVAELAGLSPNEYTPFVDWKRGGGGCPPERPQTPSNRHQSAPIGNQTKKPKAPFDWTRAHTFDYHDEGGELLFQVGRCDAPNCEKSIRQRRPDGRGGFVYSLEGVRRVLWHLPDVLEAEKVFICEGEKAAMALNAAFERAGLFGSHVATTNAQGAGKWQDDFCEALEGTAVCVLPDNDERGNTHGAAVCASIHTSGAAQWLCRLDLPDLPEKGDVCDFLEAGGSVAQLLEWLEVAPQWEPQPEPEKERRFGFKTLEQLEAEPDPDWLIHGFLTEGGTSLLTAKHGSYKSFFALEMALCVACDFPFHGHEVKEGRVVYIAAEGGSGLKKRAKAWRLHHRQDAGDNFVVLDVPLQIHDEATRAAFIEEVKALEPALIIFDTLARCAVGLDENHAGDMGRFADALGALAKATGAHALTVHHNAKNGDYRGSTALPAAVDTHITLTKGEGKGASVTLEMPKQKDFEALYPITFEPREVTFFHNGKETVSLIFEKGENPTGKAGSESSSEIERKVFEALESLATETGISSSQWKAASDERKVSNGKFYEAQKRLITPVEKGGLGLVCIVSGEHNGRGAKCARYAVVPTNTQLQNSKVTPDGVLELPDFPSNSRTPQLHSPVGSGVGVELELPIELNSGVELDCEMELELPASNGAAKGGRPSKRWAAAEGEPYRGVPSSSAATPNRVAEEVTPKVTPFGVVELAAGEEAR